MQDLASCKGRSPPKVAAATTKRRLGQGRVVERERCSRTTRRSNSTPRTRRIPVQHQHNLSILSILHVLLALVLQLLLLRARHIHAHVTCDSDQVCEQQLRPGSQCDLTSRLCTNPFVSGCLNSLDRNRDLRRPLRTCNSQDAPEDVGRICRPSALQYPEVRIFSQSWETAMFSAWILQIVLSELLDVPATIETGAADLNCNFYDPNNAFDYGATAYDYDALRTAHQQSDCTSTTTTTTTMNQNADEYQSCAHVIPEVWNGQVENYRKLEREGVIEPPTGGGAVGRLGWFIPRFLAQQDQTLLEYFGLQNQRQKAAENFPRPVTFQDYCDRVSTSGCLNDTVATRPPDSGGDEGGRFFVPEVFQGHFLFTEDNDCDLHPDSCTGHITDLPCDWSTFARQQAYHLNISVESNGSLQPNGGYTYGRLTEIFQAANATKSNLLIYWWIPEALYQEFLGTESEFMNVQLRPPDQACVEARVSSEERCAGDLGSPVGACDGEAHSLLKLITNNLLPETYAQPEALRSPAYRAIKAVTISELQLGQILDYWSARKIDRWNYDPREAVCRWVAENVNFLELFIPRTYPRTVQTREKAPVWAASVALGCVSVVLVASAGAFVVHYRARRAIRYAQVSFLLMILAGLLVTSIGATVLATGGYSRASCTIGIWMIVLGYTFSILPLIFKVAAINKMMSAAQRMKRITLDLYQLYISVAVVSAGVAVFLILWTAIDPMQGQQQLDLSTDETELGETVVELSRYCGSQSDVWGYVVVGWYCILLLIATVLAFQSRHVRQEFNESQTLAFMIYAKFVFAVLLLLTFFLESELSPQLMSEYRVLIYVLDALVSLTVYFVPKIQKALSKEIERASSFNLAAERASIFNLAAENHSDSPRVVRFDEQPGGEDGDKSVGEEKDVEEKDSTDTTSDPNDQLWKRSRMAL